MQKYLVTFIALFLSTAVLLSGAEVSAQNDLPDNEMMFALSIDEVQNNANIYYVYPENRFNPPEECRVTYWYSDRPDNEDTAEETITITSNPFIFDVTGVEPDEAGRIQVRCGLAWFEYRFFRTDRNEERWYIFTTISFGNSTLCRSTMNGGETFEGYLSEINGAFPGWVRMIHIECDNGYNELFINPNEPRVETLIDPPTTPPCFWQEGIMCLMDGNPTAPGINGYEYTSAVAAFDGTTLSVYRINLETAQMSEEGFSMDISELINGVAENTLIIDYLEEYGIQVFVRANEIQVNVHYINPNDDEQIPQIEEIIIPR